MSSQFLTALCLLGPLTAEGLRIRVTDLVSAPYVELTLAMMARFGAAARRDADAGSDSGIFAFEPTGYQAADLTIEPDASTASYFLAAAALTGSTVTVPGLGRRSAQGDLAFGTQILRRDGRAGGGHRRHDHGDRHRAAVAAASSSCATSPTRCRRWPPSPRSRTAR